ncbi:hypothetical protein E4T48_03075 [Aureobasidium sp. EXF-10727]|nr:hypothetical protein E4T48_03075 [Aureobasidium sp. EXF-10727]
MEAHTHEIAEVPEAARVITMALSMITISVLAICLSKTAHKSRTQAMSNQSARRIQVLQSWKNMSMTNALIIAIYVDSFLFIFCTAVLSKAYSLNQSASICDAAILLCLICYMTTKILIYYFLVEKVHIIRTTNSSRLKSKLWLFNFFGVICPYVILVVLNFVFRIAYINEKGVCVIGMKRRALVPLITFDVFLNVYLTSLFLDPLRSEYERTIDPQLTFAYAKRQNVTRSSKERALSCEHWSFEPLWVLFTVCVLHWATAIDKERTTTSRSSKSKQVSGSMGRLNSTNGGNTEDFMELDERYVAKLTPVIEVNRESPDLDMLNSRAIGIKTQYVREEEMEAYDIDCESGNWRESQDRIVKPEII